MSSTREFTERLRAAAARIRAGAQDFGPDRLTEPDQPSGERWDRGQVLAHVAELLPYWIAQVELVLAAGGNRAPFGRVKTDPGRIAAIEEDRGLDPEELLDRIDEGVDEAVLSMRRLSAADLACTGRHSTLGVMTVSQVLEDFVVSHLEEHADQLSLPSAEEAGEEGEASTASGQEAGGAVSGDAVSGGEAVGDQVAAEDAGPTGGADQRAAGRRS